MLNLFQHQLLEYVVVNLLIELRLKIDGLDQEYEKKSQKISPLRSR